MELESIKQHIKTAEAAVADMKDLSLRPSAFEVVLRSLLQQPRSRLSALVSTKKIGMMQKNESVSTLTLSPDQLQEFKQFYDTFNPTSREMCVFILVNFLDIYGIRESVHVVDIKYLYQQLLNLRPKTSPPILKEKQFKETISWLVAPSRKKQWLEPTEDGTYHLSAAGKIMFNELQSKLEK